MEDEISILLETFFRSFDTKDWSQMDVCLAEELELDYQSFRGTPVYVSSSKEYIAKRKVGLNDLKTEHKTFSHKIEEENIDQVKCSCHFEIRRYELSGTDFFHSFGTYQIWMKKIKGQLKITKIKQDLHRNEGNRKIHGAFKD